MAELKTKPTKVAVDTYLSAIADEDRRSDCRTLVTLMRRITQSPPRMWGTGIVGFGSYHYKYASGHEGDAALAGFASRKTDLTIYIMCGFEPHSDLMARLGKYKLGKSCLYVKRLADIDGEVLAELIKRSIAETRRRYP